MKWRGLVARLLGVVLALTWVHQLDATIFNIANGDVAGLKNAIITANSNAQNDTINLASGGTYTLTAVDNIKDGPNALPIIFKDNVSTPERSLTINGNGATIRRSTAGGTPEFRCFYVYGTLTINGLTLQNFRLSAATPDGWGAAFYNFGTLALNDCTISGNSAVAAGAIFNELTLSLNRCTLSTNAGGAIVNRTLLYLVYATSSLVNCTLNENIRTVGNTSGGAIWNICDINFIDGVAATLTSCTLSGNGLRNDSFAGTVFTLANTILFNSPIVNDPAGSVFSSGYNLSSDNGGGLLTATGDRINTDPRLDPNGLKNNLGPTKTLALSSDSPAIDQGYNFGFGTDQRGFARPINNPSIANAGGGDGSDIGAFETFSDAYQTGPLLFVNTLADHDDGVCGGTDCTLREAVNHATALPEFNTIFFASHVLGTITLTLGQITFPDSINIVGPGARLLHVSANSQSRVFQFSSGHSSMTGLTIRDGWVAAPTPSSAALGAGIYNLAPATLSLQDCTISDNRVLGGGATSPGGGGGRALGGGICNLGVLNLNRCAFIHNGASGGAGANNVGAFTAGGTGGAGQGSALYNEFGAELAINNCTFFDNVVSGGLGGNGGTFGGNGGASMGTIYSVGGITLTASTISGNYGFGGTRGLGNNLANDGVYGAGRGGLMGAGFPTIVRNTISATNIASGFSVSADVDGFFTSEGFNLIGRTNNSSGFTHATDLVGSDAAPLKPLLGAMQNNGGATDTMKPLSGSPAVERGHSFGLPLDQRSSPRRIDSVLTNASGGDGTDIGAVELNFFGGPDTDGDSLSDDFEAFFGINNPAIDSDGDKRTNLEEFRAGTNPLDPSSVLRITAASVIGTTLRVAFEPAILSKTYRLERTSVVTNSNWNSIQGLADITPTFTGTGRVTNSGGATFPQSFYRIRVLP